MPSPSAHRPRYSGFTLLEALVVVLVTAVLASLAVPAWDAAVSRQRLTTHSNTLLVSLHYARSESIKRGARVVLCKSADGDRCTPSGNWEQGWIVFVDSDNDAQRDPDELPLRAIDALDTAHLLRGNLHVAHYVSYTPHGVARRTSGAFQAGTFTLCRQSSVPTDARQVILAISGRPRVTSATLAACS